MHLKTLLRGLVVVAGCVALAASAAETIRVRADVWMPFNGGEGEAPGYVTEVLKEIFEPKGVQIEYQNLAWEKSLEGCLAGTVDAVPCASPKEAKGLLLPKETIAAIQYGMFVLKASTWTMSGPQSFVGQRIGAVPSYNYWDTLDKFIETNPKALVKLDEDAPCLDGVKKLISKEVDLMPECPQVFFWTLKEASIDASQFRMACRMPADPVYVAFRADEKGAAWARMFDEGIVELRKSGKLAKILAKYQVQDWKQ